MVNPTQNIEYLGMVINSVKLSFSLPQTKVLEVKEMCRKALVAGKVSLRNVASILGNSTSAIPSIPFAQSHYRSMQRFFIAASKKAQDNLNVKCTLSPESKTDLNWWVDNLEKVNGKEFFPKNQALKSVPMHLYQAGVQFVIM